MAATARVIWLCACVRYCRPRGWCLSVSLAFFVFQTNKQLKRSPSTENEIRIVGGVGGGREGVIEGECQGGGGGRGVIEHECQGVVV